MPRWKKAYLSIRFPSQLFRPEFHREIVELGTAAIPLLRRAAFTTLYPCSTPFFLLFGEIFHREIVELDTPHHLVSLNSLARTRGRASGQNLGQGRGGVAEFFPQCITPSMWDGGYKRWELKLPFAFLKK